MQSRPSSPTLTTCRHLFGAPHATHVARSEMQFWCRVATALATAPPSVPCVEDISNFLNAAERAEAPADTLAFPALESSSFPPSLQTPPRRTYAVGFRSCPAAITLSSSTNKRRWCGSPEQRTLCTEEGSGGAPCTTVRKWMRESCVTYARVSPEGEKHTSLTHASVRTSQKGTPIFLKDTSGPKSCAGLLSTDLSAAVKRRTVPSEDPAASTVSDWSHAAVRTVDSKPSTTLLIHQSSSAS
mmetsp:Transcript_35147/g.83273  ORF Transcript_35147/g.83273 Transcript_35147/m.83273 type:complete len:242 (-) Transcript_35147:474-1199(-)